MEQGYQLKRNICYQENECAMKMESNVRKSTSEKSRQIYIRYFFIKDVLDRDSIELIHCRTERITSD